MSRALYRKYRSKSLGELVGQSHITEVLSKAIKSGRVSHAYLLTGPRGVGKTSVARILAHEINNLPYDEDSTHLDIIEIDAASNNGVEDVRSLREKAQVAPVSAAKKVYIIDEVHMLSKPAFNALLKTLEEPPEHVVFILATTDVEKLPATIISRTQRFSFRAIKQADAIKHLRHIADSEKIKVDDEALAIIAERGDGSFRDSISLLDQLSTLADNKTGITASLVESTLGLAPSRLVSDVLDSVEAADNAQLLNLLDQASADGVSAIILANQLSLSIRRQVAEKPHLLNLLDSLLDVAKSSQPELKLLTVLAASSQPKAPPKTAALATTVREVKASVATLKKIADEPVPPAPRPKVPAADFDWDRLVEYTRTNHVALYAVLSKCTHQLDSDDLTLYTKTAFYKKKLDDPKYSAMLHTALEAIGSYALSVHTIPTAAPPKSSQVAAIADIMGGGEEVIVEDAK